MGVEPGRDDHKVGFELRRNVAEGGVEHPPLLDRGRIRLDGNVHRLTQTAAKSGFASRTGSRIPRILMHRKKVNARVIVEDALGAVAVVNVPVEDRDPLDLFVVVLCVSGGDGDIIENTETHRVFGRRVMSRRAGGDKGVLRFALHHGIDPGTGSAGREQCRIERLHRNCGVGIEPVEPVLHRSFDTFVMLRRMRREDEALRSLFRRDLVQARPQVGVTAECFHHGLVTHRGFGMPRPGIVLLIDRMMDECGFHALWNEKVITNRTIFSYLAKSVIFRFSTSVIMTAKNIIRAIDSHTAGEPTRVVVEGFPDLGAGTMAERLEIFRRDHDRWRSAVVCEPRGHDAVVGALLCEPVDPEAAAGVIFFNNVGYLGMCGHGTIGLVKTLEYMGCIEAGTHKIETPVGTVEATLGPDGSVTIENVASYRFAKDVTVAVEDHGPVTGDIAYGGNWFFLVSGHGQKIEFSNIGQLTAYSVAVRDALALNGITGEDGAEIDHIELFSPTQDADSRNFVLCPGLEYDRSPCGTGTSAKLACLFADGKLREGEIWRQESVIGSVFEGSVRIDGEKIIPSIRGNAYVTAELDLIFDDLDPYSFGITG